MMVTKLQKDDFYKVKDIFSPLRFQLFPAAVVAGLQDGDIFVDDVLNPRAAMMITREVWAYLGGEPNLDFFNQALNRAIFAKEMTPKDGWGLLVGCPEGWEQALTDIFQPRKLIELHRNHYRWKAEKILSAFPVPNGYELRLIDSDLRDLGCKLPEDVDLLLDSWERIQAPQQRGFGYVALNNGEVTAHAVVDVIVDRAGDIGLVTSIQHRLRGLGTALSAACMNYGVREKGLREYLWDCMEDNIGSIRIAEKLGFEFQENHTMYIFDFEPVVG